MLNRGDAPASATVSLYDLSDNTCNSWVVRDIWTQTDLGVHLLLSFFWRCLLLQFSGRDLWYRYWIHASREVRTFKVVCKWVQTPTCLKCRLPYYSHTIPTDYGGASPKISTNELTVLVPAHGVRLLRMRPHTTEPTPPPPPPPVLSCPAGYQPHVPGGFWARVLFSSFASFPLLSRHLFCGFWA